MRTRETTTETVSERELSALGESSTTASPMKNQETPYPVRVDDVGDDDELARVGAVVDQGDAPDLDVAGERHSF